MSEHPDGGPHGPTPKEGAGGVRAASFAVLVLAIVAGFYYLAVKLGGGDPGPVFPGAVVIPTILGIIGMASLRRRPPGNP